jgi:hypothetical protein
VVDVGDHLAAGVASLSHHSAYLDALGGDMADPASFLERAARSAGEANGLTFATTFEIVSV